MRPESRARIYDAIQAIEATLEFMTGKSLADYDRDLLLRSAVERQLQIVGEALSMLRREDPALSARIPNAAGAIGMRHVLVHGYEAVDDSVVWHTAADDLHPLLAELSALIDGSD